MNITKVKLRFLEVFLLLWAAILIPLKADPKKPTDEFLVHFVNADEAKMKQFFADKISFLGDQRFLQLKRPAEGGIVVDKATLMLAYKRMFERVGKNKWTEQMKKVRPTLVVSQEGGEFGGLVKKGDIIYDLHHREMRKGKRKGLDEAVIFIFRKTGNAYLVVGHIADY